MKSISVIIVALEENKWSEELLAERLATYRHAATSVYVVTSVPVAFSEGVTPLIYMKSIRGFWGRLRLRRFVSVSVFGSQTREKDSAWMIVADGEENILSAAYLSHVFGIPLDIAYDTVGREHGTPALLSAVKRASSVRVPSRRVANDYSARFPGGVVATILPNESLLFDISFRLAEHIPDMTHAVGYATDTESLRTLLSAWRHIVNRYPTLRLTIYVESSHGPVHEMYAPAVIHAANLSASVNTSLFPEQPQDMFRNAIFFLHVTGALPYGKRLMQAYAAGVPTVTVDTGVVGECITADHALICPMGDAACLAKQTLFMLDNPTVYSSIRFSRPIFSHNNTEKMCESLRSVWLRGIDFFTI